MQLDKLALHAQRSCLCPSDYLEQISKRRTKLHGGVSYALFSARPLQNMIRVPWLHRSVLALLVPVTIWTIYNSVLAFSQGTIPPFQHYRFTSLEQRDGSAAPGSPGIAMFGLMRLGQGGRGRVSNEGERLPCEAGDLMEGPVEVDGASMTLSLAAKADARYEMWFIRTLGGEGSQGSDAVRFVLEGSDDGEAWTTVGSSTSVSYFSVVVPTNGEAVVPEERGARLVVDARMGLKHWLAYMFASVLLYLSLIVVMALAVCGAHASCMRATVYTELLQFAFRLTIGLLMLFEEQQQGLPHVHSLYTVAIAFGNFLAVLVLLFFQELIELCLFASALQPIMQALLHQGLFGAPLSFATAPSRLLANVALFLLGVSVFAMRVRIVLSAQRHIAHGRALYQEVWQRVCKEQFEGVGKLASTIAKIQCASEGVKARQVNRKELKQVQGMCLQGQQGAMSRRRSSFAGMGDSSQWLPPGSSFLNRRPSSHEGGPSSAEGGASSPTRRASSPTRTSYVPEGGASSPPRRSSSPVRRSSMSVRGMKQWVRSGSFRSSVAPEPDQGQEKVLSESFLSTNVLQSREIGQFVLGRFAPRDSSDMGKPIETLDQLHSQAFLVHGIFESYVFDLARRHFAKFRLRQDPRHPDFGLSFDTWDGDSKSLGRFRLGGVKSVWSAMRKLDMAYNGDTSQILDMCRKSLYFDSVLELNECLKEIGADTSIEIAHVKNTMQMFQEGSQSVRGLRFDAGMPFVKVNLRMAENAEARRLCVDTHWCELLLVLTDIGKLQTGHMRDAYASWRMCFRVISVGYWRQKGALMPGKASYNTPLAKVSPVSDDEEPEVSACKSDRHLLQSRSSIESKEGSIKSKEDKSVEGARSECLSASDAHRGSILDATGSHVQLSWERSGGGADVEEIGQEGEPSGGNEESRWQGGKTSWGVEVGKDMEELLEGLARMSTLGVADILDRQWRAILKGGPDNCSNSTSLGSLFYAKKILTAATFRWQFQFFLLSLGIWLIYDAAMCLLGFYPTYQGPYALGPYKHYRLETLLTRDSSVGRGVRGPGVSDFGLLGPSRCAPKASFSLEGHGNTSQSKGAVPSFSGPIGSSFLLSYPEGGASMTGWYVRTLASEGSQGRDASFFSVWGSNDELDVGDGSCALGREDERWWLPDNAAEWCGAQWQQVGGTHWRFTASTGPAFYSYLQMPISLPIARNVLESWILKPNWNMFTWRWVVPNMAVGITSIIAATKRYIRIRQLQSWIPAPHNLISFGWGVACLSSLIHCVWAGVNGVPHMMYESLWGLVSWIFILFGCIWQGRAFMYCIWCHTLIQFGTWIGLHIWTRVTLETVGFPTSLVMTLVLAGGLAGGITALRMKALRWSKMLLSYDKSLYDNIWKSLYDSEDGVAGILHLEKVVRMIGLDASNLCKQRLRLRADNFTDTLRVKYLGQVSGHPAIYPLFWDLRHWYIPGRPDHKTKLASMSQLYSGAAIANLLLRDRVKDWADRSSAMVKLPRGLSGGENGESKFVRWRDVKEDAEIRKRVQWTDMKRHTRAMEKLIRSYGNAPSSLLDISRSCLVFEDMSHLTNCLGLIVTDENVRVERVKNRMSPSYDSNETGGYRDVCVNLKIVSQEAQCLGAELVVCEVQLLLLDFAKLRTTEGHHRYVQVRNSRGT